jgi:hypothetical protein
VFSGDANPTKIAARISSKPSCRCCSTKLSKLFEFRLIITWELRESPEKWGKSMMLSTLFRDVKPVHGAWGAQFLNSKVHSVRSSSLTAINLVGECGRNEPKST